MRYLACLNPVRSAARRPISAICIALYLIAWIGVPLPVLSAPPAGASQQRFPCEHHHCGCATAEQCWTSCCCMSLKERLAWAKANGVQPPAWIVISPEHDADQTKADVPQQSCKGHCCCCAQSAHSDGHKRRDDYSVQQHSGTTYISFLAAQRCRGASTQWVASGAVLVPARILEIQPDTTVTSLQPPASLNVEAPLFKPAVPPPRSHSAL